jgi:hypothetical protein
MLPLEILIVRGKLYYWKLFKGPEYLLQGPRI